MRIGTHQVGGTLLIAIGILAASMGRDYSVGSLSQMGPGFLPMSLAGILCILGIANILGAGKSVEPGDHSDKREFISQLRSGFFVLLGIVVFGILINRIGLVITTAIVVLIVSYANNRMTFISRIASSFFITALSTILFGFLLPLPVRIFISF